MNTCVCRPSDRPETATAWTLPGGGYWAGRWRNANRTLAVQDPGDDSVIAHVADAGASDVAEAVAGARDSLREPWPLWQRREALDAAHLLVLAEAERLAHIIAAEGSKTLAEAKREVKRCAETLRLSSVAGGALEGSTLPLEDTPRGAGRVGWSRREPVGVVAAITPFNDPLNLVAHKVGPALVAGNAVVLKPATVTPLSALALTDILLRAGVPGGRIATLVGSGSLGAALVADPGVDLISFTGGPATADRIARSAGAKKLLMELGGNNATIVCADADVAKAAEAIVDGAFGAAGQNCLSVQRVYAHASVFDQLLRHVAAGASALRTGCKMEPQSHIGPLITVEEALRVESWVDEARRNGATVHAGGHRTGNYYAPTVLSNARTTDRVVADEVFGPVVTVFPYERIEDALAAADATEFGLQAGIFTQSMATALRAVESLRVGSVIVNGTSDFRIDAMPFGGFKKSGIGREGIASAVEAMTEPKNVILNLA